jgi:capsule polysaccharide export protein KpsE/RkpR
MASIFSRLNSELENFGRRASAALDEGRLQIELLRVKRSRDNAARDLGMLAYHREKGVVADQRRVDALVLKIGDLEAEIASIETQIATQKAVVVSVTATPADEPEPEPDEQADESAATKRQAE